MIKLESLRVFVTVAQTGNIRDAAERLFRTVSAVSMTLKQLEGEIGGPLFESDRKNRLSALGAFVLHVSRAQILGYDKAINQIQAYAQSRIGHLTLASVPSVAANLIPAFMPRFVADRPGIEIELFDLDSLSVRSMVESGRADLGIAGDPGANTKVDFEPLFRDRFRVICGATSTLARHARPLCWSDLAGEALILNGASQAIQSPHYRALSEKAAMTVHNLTSLMALARAGLGITLLPALATVDLREGVAALDLEDTVATRTVGLLERRSGTRSPAAAAFREFMLAQMPARIAELGLEAV